MPKYVDHDDRRQDIIETTLRVLAEHGPKHVSFRTVSSEMGGSSTLITHYFPTRQALLDALIETVWEWPEEIAELEADTDDPRERLRILLRWVVPGTERGALEETARIKLLGERDTRLRTDHIFETWDREVRKLIASHLRPLIAKNRIRPTVELLRSVTNGITLSVVEQPSEWPSKRQFAVIDEVLRALDLSPVGPVATRA